MSLTRGRSSIQFRYTKTIIYSADIKTYQQLYGEYCGATGGDCVSYFKNCTGIKYRTDSGDIFIPDSNEKWLVCTSNVDIYR